jgi:hypothetical protein
MIRNIRERNTEIKKADKCGRKITQQVQRLREPANQAMCKYLMIKSVYIFSVPYRIKSNLVGVRCCSELQMERQRKKRQSNRQAERDTDRRNPILVL